MLRQFNQLLIMKIEFLTKENSTNRIAGDAGLDLHLQNKAVKDKDGELVGVCPTISGLLFVWRNFSSQSASERAS